VKVLAHINNIYLEFIGRETAPTKYINYRAKVCKFSKIKANLSAINT
jgi:hypothetical protein